MSRLLFLILLAIPFFGFAQFDTSSGLSSQLTKSKIYGAYCGIAGKHPTTRILAEELIANEDIIALTDWLSSPNHAIQTYAAEAFIRLSNMGVQIEREIYLTVSKLKNSKELISTCKGCIYEELTIKESLKDFEFEEI